MTRGLRAALLLVLLGLTAGSARAAPEAKPEPAHAGTAEQIPPEAERHCDLADLYCERGQLEQALGEYQEAVKLHRDYSRAENNWGFCLFRLKRLPEAIEHYTRALQLDPRYAVACNNLGVAYYQQRHYAEAQRQFEEAVRLQPKYAKARVNLAAALYKRRHYFRAMRELRRAKRIDKAYTEERLDPQRLRAQVERDLAAHPDDPTLKRLLAELERQEREHRRPAARTEPSREGRGG